MRGDRIERFGDRYFSYLYAGETSSEIGYLLVSDEWREIALLAFQQVLFASHSQDYQIQVGGEIADDEASIRAPSFDLEAIFRPSLDADASARKCKLRMGDVAGINTSLMRRGYFDLIPHLRPHRAPSDLEDIAIRFSEFSGEQGWKIQPHQVLAFVSQFPPRLRTEVLEILRDPERLLFLNRVDTINLVIKALGKLRLERPLRLVPLTPSSGQYIRNHIRSLVDPGMLSVHASLTDALTALSESGGSVVFIDDNIASGTQASRQIEIYMGAAPEKPAGNYVIDQLDDNAKRAFTSRPIGAAFSIGHEDGKRKLIETCQKHQIKLVEENISWGRSIVEVSGKDKISNELRIFLKDVGEQVLRRRLQREANIDAEKIASRFALGYGEFEGLVVTSFSVPTSTYPAFWCPGIREVSLSADADPVRFPWIPLFLRTNMLRHLVLG